jgi:hypothetical protein
MTADAILSVEFSMVRFKSSCLAKPLKLIPMALPQSSARACPISCCVEHLLLLLIVLRAVNGKPVSFIPRLCKKMCPSPRLPGSPVFGCNDWYYAYGNTSADQTRRDTRTIVSLTSGTNIRTFATIDGGWQFDSGAREYDWVGSDGTDPFESI